MNKTQLEALIQSKLEEYKKVPFIHNGRDMQGLDCLGFLILFYREFGVKIPGDDGREIDKDWYKKEPDRYIKAIDKLPGRNVSFYDLQALDLVYFAVSRDIITHTGIMINDREFAHMSPKKNFQISLIGGPWRRRSRGGKRLIDIDLL